MRWLCKIGWGLVSARLRGSRGGASPQDAKDGKRSEIVYTAHEGCFAELLDHLPDILREVRKRNLIPFLELDPEEDLVIV